MNLLLPLLFLIGFPLLAALVLLVSKADSIRGIVVRISALVIAVGSIFLLVTSFGSGPQFFAFHNEWIDKGMMAIEILIAVFITYLGIKYKKYLAIVFTWCQLALLLWFENTSAHGIEIQNTLFFDNFSVIMTLIIGIIGSAICVYAIGYMKDFNHHHDDVPDRRPLFFFLMFLFLSAMFGLVFSNNIIWLYFFWEVTTLCSFLLIGYTKTEEAINNAFKALVYNLIGGLGFAIGIVVLGVNYGTLELDKMLTLAGSGPAILVVALAFAFAGMAKAAQLPFSGWLLGAMVAPTPTSALLHSSTMVKAGVYLVLRMSPLLVGNYAGIVVSLIGMITFAIGSFIAISQSNAKKVLAWSTVANLGLIIACAGIGTYEAVWAGILLVIFHAVAKSLLFLSVGTVEHSIGSRDIEDMDNLISRMPKVTLVMIIGILGMFLAPFGMLISKWAALKAFVDTKNVLIVIMLAFGSAATLFFWTKWLGKIIAISSKPVNQEAKVHKDEWFSLGLHACLVVVICFAFPLISSQYLVPYLDGVYGAGDIGLSAGNLKIMTMMLLMLLLLPIGLVFYGKEDKIVNIYLSGRNLKEDMNHSYRGSMNRNVEVKLSNYYMEEYFGEKKLHFYGVVITSSIFIFVISLISAVLISTYGKGAV